MLVSVKSRFRNIELHVQLVTACLLDPRFKDRLFSGTTEQAEATRMLLEKLDKANADKGSLEPPPKHHNKAITELGQSLMRY